MGTHVQPVPAADLSRTGQDYQDGLELRTYLPGDVKANAVTAQLSNGVLTVTVPKAEAAKRRKIEITG